MTGRCPGALVPAASVLALIAVPQPACAQTEVERGRVMYATYCAPCHGAGGAGDGPLAAMLRPRPVRHDDRAYMDGLSDGYLMLLLKAGGPALGKSPLMGQWGRRLSHQQLQAIVAYMRTLPALRAARDRE